METSTQWNSDMEVTYGATALTSGRTLGLANGAIPRTRQPKTAATVSEGRSQNL